MSQIRNFRTALINIAAASGTQTIIPALAGTPFKIWKIFFVTDTATAITFYAAGVAQSGPIPLTANGSFTLMYDGSPQFYVPPGGTFAIDTSASASIGGTVYYTRG